MQDFTAEVGLISNVSPFMSAVSSNGQDTMKRLGLYRTQLITGS
jgi:hypothetical protein